MGGVYGHHAGHGCKPRREQHLGGSHRRRDGDAIDAERARLFAGVVAGREDAGVSFLAQRRIASVFALDGWRRSTRANETLDRRGYGEVVAGWKDDRLYIFGLSRLRGRRV